MTHNKELLYCHPDKKIRLLIVDDEAEIVNALKRTFRGSVYDVQTASDGLAALNLIKDDYFDVIISDLSMPEMNGADFLIKAYTFYPHIKLIVLSAQLDRASFLKLLNDTSVFACFEKPWNELALQLSVKNAAEQRYRELLMRDLTAQKVETLESLLDIDPLTHTYNHQRLEQILMVQIEIFRRFGNQFGLICLQMDDFNELINKHEPTFKETVLKQFASTLQNRLRNYDYLGRWNESTFVIICPNTSYEQVIMLTEDIRARCKSNSLDHIEHLSCAFAITECNSTEITLDDLKNWMDSVFDDEAFNQKDVAMTFSIA